MSAASELFRTLFGPGPTKIVWNVDVDGPTLAMIVKFIYTAQCEINESNVSILMAVASKWGIVLLSKNCVEFYKRNVSDGNCVQCLNDAERNRCDELITFAREAIGQRWTTMKKFAQIGGKNLTEMLKNKWVAGTEIEILHRIMQWTAADGDRVKLAVDLLQYLILDSMSTDVCIY